MTCAIHVIVTKSSAVEDGNVRIIYDRSRRDLHFRGHAHSVRLLATFETKSFVVTDGCRGHGAGHRWETAPYDILWSYQKPLDLSLMRPETAALQATATKHARQVWLFPLVQIDIKLSHKASAIKHARTVSSQTL